MKIGIDIRTLMDKKYSGVSEYTLNLVREIIKQFPENEYKLFYNSFSDISNKISELEASNVEIVKKSYPNKILNYLLFKIFNWPKVDKLLGVDFFLMPHINFIGLSGRAKSILVIHDVSFLRYPEFFSTRKNIWHKIINVKKLVKKFDIIVAVSENTKNDLVELCKVNPDRIKVIYSGLEKMYKIFDQHDEKAISKVREKYNLPDKYILFLGNVEPRKNIRGLVRAYNILREEREDLANYKLLIAGGVSWKHKEILKEQQISKFKEDIIFLGYVEKADKPFLYNQATLFVWPSFYEGFGFPPLEAQACGTPVIASFSSSLPEILESSALLIDPYNEVDLARAMMELLSNKTLKEKMSASGLENAKRFNWEGATRKYFEIF